MQKIKLGDVISLREVGLICGLKLGGLTHKIFMKALEKEGITPVLEIKGGRNTRRLYEAELVRNNQQDILNTYLRMVSIGSKGKATGAGMPRADSIHRRLDSIEEKLDLLMKELGVKSEKAGEA